MKPNKQLISQHFDKIAPHRSRWFERNWIYHEQIVKVCQPFLNPDSRVLELGCSTGNLLNALKPGFGVGVDLSAVSIDLAKTRYPGYQWICADVEALPDTAPLDQAFDVVIISDLIAYLDDVEQMFRSLHRLTHAGSRIIVSFWNWMWQPILEVGERLKLKAPDLDIRMNWLSPTNVCTMLELADYQVLQVLPGLLFPYALPILTPVVNSLAQVAFIRPFVLSNTIVVRPNELTQEQPYSVSVIIPTRNEAGNIEAAVQGTPSMGKHTELIFVDGDFTDGTVEKIHEQIALHPELDIKFVPQVPPKSPDADAPASLMLRLGKGDAVRKGFAIASGDILMILDSDLTVPPEELPKFFHLLAAGKAEMGNGTRFVYQQQSGAMPLLNRLGNVFFSKLFTWLLGQPITDTLCGTKVLFRTQYEAITANRERFGDFDPFGDFDLLFGAAWLGQRIKEVPIHYRARTYGTSKVRTRLHGPLLGRMSLIALWHFKINSAGRSAAPPKTHREYRLILGMVVFALFLLRLAGRRTRSR